MIHGAYFTAKAEKHAFIPTEDGRISIGPSAAAEDAGFIQIPKFDNTDRSILDP